jgi:ribonuclease-3
VPEYDVTESGPDHAKAFEATAVVGGRRVGVGQGRSKKEAEQRAAERAWQELSTEGDEDTVLDTDPDAVR